MPESGGVLDQPEALTAAIHYYHRLEDPYRAKRLGPLTILANLV